VERERSGERKKGRVKEVERERSGERKRHGVIRM